MLFFVDVKRGEVHMRISNNPYQEYQNNSVETANQQELIIMLYEGAIRFLENSITYLDSYKTYDKANTQILKAQDIVTELMVSLDMEKGGEIAQNLMNLYVFMKKLLIEGNMEKNSKKILLVIGYLQDLLDAWKQIDKHATTAPSYKDGFAIQG